MVTIIALGKGFDYEIDGEKICGGSESCLDGTFSLLHFLVFAACLIFWSSACNAQFRIQRDVVGALPPLEEGQEPSNLVGDPL